MNQSIRRENERENQKEAEKESGKGETPEISKITPGVIRKIPGVSDENFRDLMSKLL